MATAQLGNNQLFLVSYPAPRDPCFAGRVPSACNTPAAPLSHLPLPTSPQDSIYGVLYLLTKEPVDSSKSMAYLKLLFECLQMLVFLITPEWGWFIETSNRLYPWFRRSQLQWIIVEKGYKVFTIAIFLAAGGVASLLAALAFVSHEFKSNRLQQIKWVLRVCRVLVFLVFDMFYVSLLALFLTGTGEDMGPGGAKARD